VFACFGGASLYVSRACNSRPPDRTFREMTEIIFRNVGPSGVTDEQGLI
jgi:hypothetical protein